MKTDQELLTALFDAIPLEARAVESIRLQHPIEGLDTVDDLRRAVEPAAQRGYLHTPEDVLAGGIFVSLTQTGRELLPGEASG